MGVYYSNAIPLKYDSNEDNPYVSYWIGKGPYGEARADKIPGRELDSEGNIVIKNGKLREGAMLRKATLRDVLQYQAERLDPTRAKHMDGCMHTYVADYTWVKSEIVKQGIRSGGVMEIDLDTKKSADAIYNGFDKLCQKVDNLVAVTYSASHKVHAFMITPSCTASEYVVNMAASYIILIEAIKSELGIDLYEEEKQTGEKLVDDSLIKITQKMFLHGSGYRWNNKARPIRYGLQLLNNLRQRDPKHLFDVADTRAGEYEGKEKKSVNGLRLSQKVKVEVKDIVSGDVVYLDHNWRFFLAATLDDIGYSDQEKYEIMKKNLSPGDYNAIEWDEAIRRAIAGDYSVVTDDIKYKIKEMLEKWGIEIDASYVLNPSKFPQIDPKYAIHFDKIIELEDNQYLSQAYKFEEGKNVYICADCGLGKTEFAKELAKQRPIDIILPMHSILDGKFSKKDNIHTIKSGDEPNRYISQAMIWDKWVKIPFAERKKVNVFDETHLLITHSDFRRTAVTLIDQLERVNGDKIFLDGTPLGEQLLLGTNTEMIRVTRKPKEGEWIKNDVTFHICDNLSKTVKKFIENNKDDNLIIMRTDQYADTYRDELNKEGMHIVEYRRDKKDDEDMLFINKTKKLPDGTDAVLSTKYYEAGIEVKRKEDVELWDKLKPNMLIVPNWNADRFCAQEMIQSANRFREEGHNIHIFCKASPLLGVVNDNYIELDPTVVDAIGNESGLIAHDTIAAKAKYLDAMELKDIYDKCGASLTYYKSFPIVYRVFEQYGYTIKIIYEDKVSVERGSSFDEMREEVSKRIIDNLDDMTRWWKSAEQQSCKNVEEILISEKIMRFPRPGYVDDVMHVVYGTFKNQLLIGVDVSEQLNVMKVVLKSCFSSRGGISIEKLRDWYRFNKYTEGDEEMVKDIREDLCCYEDKETREEKSRKWWKNYITQRLLNMGKTVDLRKVNEFYNVSVRKFIDIVELLFSYGTVTVNGRTHVEWTEDAAVDYMLDVTNPNFMRVMSALTLDNCVATKRKREGNSKGGKKGRQVCIEGMVYDSVNQAATTWKVNEGTVRRRLKSEKWRDWYYM